MPTTTKPAKTKTVKNAKKAPKDLELVPDKKQPGQIAEKKRAPIDRGTAIHKAIETGDLTSLSCEDARIAEAAIKGLRKKKGVLVKLKEVISLLKAQEPAGYNDFHKYTYFTEDQLLDALNPLLDAAGLVMTMEVASVNVKEFVNAKKNPEQLFIITTEHMILDEETDEKLKLRFAGSGADASDKGLYKAMTGAHKYFLQKTFRVVIRNVDPDGDENLDRRTAAEAPHSAYTDNAEGKVATDTEAGVSAIKGLREFMAANGITEAFVIELAVKGKLADGPEKQLEELRPGTVAKLNQLHATILERWQEAKDAENTARVTVEGRDPVEVLREFEVDWIMAVCQDGTKLGSKTEEDILDLAATWFPRKRDGVYTNKALVLDAALCLAQAHVWQKQNERAAA